VLVQQQSQQAPSTLSCSNIKSVAHRTFASTATRSRASSVESLDSEPACAQRVLVWSSAFRDRNTSESKSLGVASCEVAMHCTNVQEVVGVTGSQPTHEEGVPDQKLHKPRFIA
jgi:hypothetical protein